MFTPRLNYLLQRNKNSLDFVRFVAAILVIYSHLYIFPGTQGWVYDPISWLTRRKEDSGSLAVNVFFIISGFLIAASIDYSQNWVQFIKARLLRIYPALIVLVLLSVFVFGPVLTSFPVVTYFQQPATYNYFKVLTLVDAGNYVLPGVFMNNPRINFNGPLWSLAFEVLCYFTVLILWILRLFKKRIVLILFLCLICFNFLIQRSFFEAHQDNALITTASYFLNSDTLRNIFLLHTLFLSGTVLYLYRNQIKMKGRYLFLAVPLFLITILLENKLFFSGVWLPTFGTYYLFYFSTWQRSPFKHFGAHGDFSYGLYIYGYLIQQSVIHFWGNTFSPWVNFALSVVISLLFAFFSWHVIEKRALKLKSKPLLVRRKVMRAANS